MTGPMPITPDDAEFQKWKAARTPVTHDDAEFQEWKAKQGGGIQDISAQLQKQADAQGVGAGSPPVSGLAGIKKGFQSDMAGLPARAVALTQGIPGVRRLAEGINSKMMGVPYAQVDASVEKGLQSVPTVQRLALGMVGSAAVAPFLPANPALAGGILGGADQALSAAPESARQRIQNTLTGAGTGAAAGYLGGKAADMIGARMQARATPTLGAQQLAREEAMGAADKVNYGTAKGDAAFFDTGNQATPQALSDALGSKTARPYVKLVLSNPRFEGADDATVGMEVFKQLGAEQGGLLDRLDKFGYNAKLAIKADKLGQAKDALRQALAPVIPSFDNAVSTHAANEGGISAMQAGARAMRTVDQPTIETRLSTQSPEAFTKLAGKFDQSQSDAAAQGILGRLKETPAMRKFVIPSKATRAAPGLLRQVGQEPMSAMLRNIVLGVVNSPFTNRGRSP